MICVYNKFLYIIILEIKGNRTYGGLGACWDPRMSQFWPPANTHLLKKKSLKYAAQIQFSICTNTIFTLLGIGIGPLNYDFTM